MVVSMADAAHTWAVQDAKSRFSELIERCRTDGPQTVTKRGAETAVVVSIDEWRRLQQRDRPTLKQLLLSDSARTDELVRDRDLGPLRPGGEFE